MYLKPNSTIGVMAPSSYVEKNDIEKSATRLKNLGLNVFVHPQTFERSGQSAGDTLQKSLAFQGLWMRKDIDAIWFAGGGNQALDLLSTINFDTLKRVPAKPLIGFSDTTSLLNAVYSRIQSPSFHAPVFKQLHSLSDTDITKTMGALQGTTKHITINDGNTVINANDKTITGTLIGGNLSIVQYMPSLFPNLFEQDNILFIEDCNEEISRIDRMISYLKQVKAFDNTKAILLGQFSGLTDTGRPFGKTIEDIIKIHLEDLNIPILFNLPFGHTGALNPIPLGKLGTLDMVKHSISWT